ncbi:hypothetical protein [Streptomyces sp. NPDC001381]|uniref:hypothetical protein n=1 Tax=Streptomyces sp. NPDC001381 TaxID=3364567 RepID=UPI00369B181B
MLPPLILKTEANPKGLPIEAFDAIRAGVAADRSQFYHGSPGLRRGLRLWTDFAEDLTIGIPVLMAHGHDDQIVPVVAADHESIKLLSNGTLKVYADAPHGLVGDFETEFKQGPARLHRELTPPATAACVRVDVAIRTEPEGPHPFQDHSAVSPVTVRNVP